MVAIPSIASGKLFRRRPGRWPGHDLRNALVKPLHALFRQRPSPWKASHLRPPGRGVEYYDLMPSVRSHRTRSRIRTTTVFRPLRHGHREERSVSDDKSARSSKPVALTAALYDSRLGTKGEVSKHVHHFEEASFPACGHCARRGQYRWRCRCWIRWFRRKHRCAQDRWRTSKNSSTSAAVIEMVHGAAGSTVEGQSDQVLLVAHERG